MRPRLNEIQPEVGPRQRACSNDFVVENRDNVVEGVCALSKMGQMLRLVWTWCGHGVCGGHLYERPSSRRRASIIRAREGARAPRRSLGTSPRAKMTDHRESDGGQIGLVGCGGAIFFWDEHGKF